MYQDDSSDEISDVLDELLLPASDVEDNWNLDDDDEEEEEEHISDKDEEQEEGSDEDSVDGNDVEMANGVGSDGSDDDMESD